MATLAEAQATAAAQNQEFEGEPILSVIIQVFPNWQLDNYETIFIPSKYQTQYNNATLEQKVAFARVNQVTLINGYTSTANYVERYDARAALDSVLSVYLGL